jgi:hypothetical protein
MARSSLIDGQTHRVEDFGIGPMRRTVVAAGGKEYVVELTRLGVGTEANAGGVLLDLLGWVSGRLGGRPWGVTIRPHPTRFGPEREFRYRTREEAGAALFSFVGSIPHDGLPDEGHQATGG